MNIKNYTFNIVFFYRILCQITYEYTEKHRKIGIVYKIIISYYVLIINKILTYFESKHYNYDFTIPNLT